MLRIKKYIILLMIILSLIMVLFGCIGKSNQGETKKKSQEGSQETNTVLSPKKLKIDGLVNSIAVVGDKYYYSQDVESNSDAQDQKIYEYNLTTDEIYELGTITKCNTYLSSYAFLNNKIYFTRGCMNESGSLSNVHYVMDLEQKNIQILREDEKDKYNPLVSSLAVNEQQFIEFEVEESVDGYRYSISRNDTEGNRKEIIATEYKSGNGDQITCVSVSNETIYTVEYYKLNQKTEMFLCSYNLDGIQLSKESIKETNDFLDTPNQFTGEPEILWEMQSFQNYYYFRTLNAKILLLKKDGSNYEKIDNLSVDTMEYLAPVRCINSEQNEFIFFNRGKRKFYRLFTDSGKSQELKLDSEGINYGVNEGNRLVYTTDANEVYFVEF